MDERFEQRRCRFLSSAVLAAVVTLAAVAPCWALNKALLVRELQLPNITLNLDISFPARAVRIPPSADPESDIKALYERLKEEDTPSLHLQLGRLLLWTSQTEEAVIQYRLATDGFTKLLEQEPDNAQAHQEFAEVLLAIGEDEEASLHIEEAFVLDGTRWQAHELASYLHAKHGVLAHNSGVQWLANEHFASAEVEARAAAKLGPKEALPYISLFLSKWLPALLELRADPTEGLKDLGTYEEISELLQTGAALAPTYPQLKQYAISCKLAPFFAAQMVKGIGATLWADLDEQQKRILTACRDEFLELGQTDPRLRSNALLFAGVANFMMDDKPKMYEAFQQAADGDPEGTAALETMVGFLANDREWVKALEAAEVIMQRQPSGTAYSWIGRIYAEQKKWSQAEKAFRVALSYDDVQGIANLGLGVVLLKSGAEPDKARVPLQIARYELAGQPEALMAWGVLLVLEGDEEGGKRYVNRAVALLPASPGRDAVAKEFGIAVE